MKIPAIETAAILLEERALILSDLSTNYVHLATLENRSIESLLAELFDEGTEDAKASSIIEAVAAADGQLSDAVTRAAAAEKNTFDTLISLGRSEKLAEDIRNRFRLTMLHFEKTPSSDTRMAQIQAKIEEFSNPLSVEVDTCHLESQLEKFQQDPLITHLDAKHYEHGKFSWTQRLIAKWCQYEAYKALEQQLASTKAAVKDIVERRKSRIDELDDIRNARTIAYRKQVRERIAKELNEILIDVESFDKTDEIRALAVTELNKTVDIFKARRFNLAKQSLVETGSRFEDIAAAIAQQLEQAAISSRAKAAADREKYKKYTELFRLVRQHFAFEPSYSITRSELIQLINTPGISPEEVFVNLCDRVVVQAGAMKDQLVNT